MASATLSDATINLINNECKKATAPEISRKIARCRGHMTTIRNKMEGNVRTLKTHPANDAAATELKRHLDDINAQYWRASYLMEIYISVLEEEARQEEREPVDNYLSFSDVVTKSSLVPLSVLDCIFTI